MATEYTSFLGSGTTPGINSFPGASPNMPEGSYPVPTNRGVLSARVGTGSVLINPEDLSAFLGVQSQAVTVDTSATLIPPTPLEYRRAILICNNGPGTIYIGNSGVTTSTGLPIAVNEKIAFDLQGVIKLWAVSTVATDVRILEIS